MDQAGEASLSTTRSGVQFGSRKEDSEVWDDFDEKVTPHEERVKFYMNVGNKHFSEDAMNAEITVDKIIQDRAAMSTGKKRRPRRDCVGDDQDAVSQTDFIFFFSIFFAD